jgi:hypothetical protein
MQAEIARFLKQEDCMANLILMGFHFFTSPEDAALGNGMWIFLSVGAVALFVVFIPTVTWIDSRRKEREAYYKAETVRRITESSPDGANAALEMMREEGRQEQIRIQEGLKIGGLITFAVGVALIIFLRALIGNEPVYLCGLIPAFIGAAMLGYVFFLATPVK